MKRSPSCLWVCAIVLAGGQMGNALHAAELLRGPYLQVPTSESIIIRWRTDVPTETVVFYGLETNNLSSSASEFTPTNEHVVQLIGLTPATRYYYSIGSVTETFATGSDYKFLTSPTAAHTGSTRVWALGDFGGISMGYEDGNTNYIYGELAVRNSYLLNTAGRQTDVWLPLGDLAYWGGTDEEFQTNFFMSLTQSCGKCR